MGLVLPQTKLRNKCIYFRRTQLNDYHVTSSHMPELAVPLPSSQNSIYKCIILLY
jgi:hypothetical protein